MRIKLNPKRIHKIYESFIGSIKIINSSGSSNMLTPDINYSKKFQNRTASLLDFWDLSNNITTATQHINN